MHRIHNDENIPSKPTPKQIQFEFHRKKEIYFLLFIRLFQRIKRDLQVLSIAKKHLSILQPPNCNPQNKKQPIRRRQLLTSRPHTSPRPSPPKIKNARLPPPIAIEKPQPIPENKSCLSRWFIGKTKGMGQIHRFLVMTDMILLFLVSGDIPYARKVFYDLFSVNKFQQYPSSN